MSDSFLTLTDLVKINSAGVNDLGVTDLTNDAPFIRVLAATTASNGTKHSYVAEDGAPTVGFRSVNTGRDNSKSSDRQVDIDLKLLDASFTVDIAIAKAYRRGADAYIAREAGRHLKAGLFEFESQVVNGTFDNASGFTGFRDTLTLAHAMTLNATGTTANTGSSIYLVRTNSDETDVVSVIGNDGEITIDETVVIKEFDEYGVGFSAYHTPIMGWLGLQVGGAKSVARICNLTADSGKGATDAKIADALSLFPASRQPNYIVMNRRSLKQLQASRTATNATGAPAPFPSEAFGIPVVVTDAITSTEAILA